MNEWKYDNDEWTIMMNDLMNENTIMNELLINELYLIM